MASPQGLCLAIGLNQVNTSSPAYSDLSVETLTGCVDDAQSVAALVQALPNYQTPTLLTNAEATTAAVTSSIQSAAQTLNPGDLFVLHYSGHGMQGTVDANGNPEPDSSESSSWILYDAPMADDELTQLLSGFQAGVRVLVISDSCFSALAIRASAFPTRCAVCGEIRRFRFSKTRRPIIRSAPRIGRDSPRVRSRRPRRRSSSLRVAAPNESALDMDNSDSEPHGLYTETLLSVWNNGEFQGSYTDFQSTIAAQTTPRRRRVIRPRRKIPRSSRRATRSPS